MRNWHGPSYDLEIRQDELLEFEHRTIGAKNRIQGLSCQRTHNNGTTKKFHSIKKDNFDTPTSQKSIGFSELVSSN